MSETFDAYKEWLDIGPDEQPPNHYCLLDLPLYEELPELIEEAVATEMEELAAEEKDLFDESKLDEEAAVSDEAAEAEAEEPVDTKPSDQPLFDESALAAEAAESDESVPEIEKVDEVDLFAKGELDDS